MQTVTAAFRFPCNNINDMRKIATSSVPFPRVHFFMPILANLQPRFSEKYERIDAETMISNLFDIKNCLVSCPEFTNRYMTVTSLFRGKLVTTLNAC